MILIAKTMINRENRTIINGIHIDEKRNYGCGYAMPNITNKVDFSISKSDLKNVFRLLYQENLLSQYEYENSIKELEKYAEDKNLPD